jgi:hypothetical protein
MDRDIKPNIEVFNAERIFRPSYATEFMTYQQ